jgi:hypothetical protein
VTACTARILHACEGAFGEDVTCALEAPHTGLDHEARGGPIDLAGNTGWTGIPPLLTLPLIRWRTQ